MRVKGFYSFVNFLALCPLVLAASFNPGRLSQCTLHVFLNEENELEVFCPNEVCTGGGTGDCSLQVTYHVPTMTIVYKCKCSGGGGIECGSSISLHNGIATVICTNPCTGGCEFDPLIDDEPRVPCFCP